MTSCLWIRSRRGVTLIELLVTIVIGLIAFMALSVPFVAERALSISGNNQTESQRDAQVALHAIARAVRHSSGYDPVTNTFTAVPCPGPDGVFDTADDFLGTQRFAKIGAQLIWTDGCNAQTMPFIDGVRSQVVSFTITPDPTLPTRLVQVQLTVQHQSTVGGGRMQTEALSTQLYLRNAP